ncbi:uncharacterized protein J7T55_015609 [Diaporthe amygdali]|uniref:uncharacterized protein n=1 Tax=Phomopsis amygdali TaxID=1214568 RepID=UPI0022FDE519|nr:uncharacterized protein J7T55_015609 [Diaporthe amygdali]KAJ0120874.1 uncharacterized protein J7T55_015609 [Diaporthe amygdali]
MDATIAQEAQDIENEYLSGARKESEGSLKLRVYDLWRRARNWHTITELNRRYLQRRLPVCPSYGMAPDSETDSFTSLLRLHDYGIISTNSCPGWQRSQSDTQHRGFGPVRQRAYMFFSIPTLNSETITSEALSVFIENLLSAPEVYAYIRFQYDNAPNGVERLPEINHLMGEYGSCSSLPAYGERLWKKEEWDVDDGTVYFVNEQKQSSQQWVQSGIYGIVTSGSTFHDAAPPLPASHAADPLQIAVVARDWDFRQIGELLERLLNESGIRAAYIADN